MRVATNATSFNRSRRPAGKAANEGFSHDDRPHVPTAAAAHSPLQVLKMAPSVSPALFKTRPAVRIGNDAISATILTGGGHIVRALQRISPPAATPPPWLTGCCCACRRWCSARTRPSPTTSRKILARRSGSRLGQPLTQLCRSWQTRRSSVHSLAPTPPPASSPHAP